ncbi:hypothetical protein ACI784_06460 [Geodermatophilus sp. SYSU D01186]
MTDQQRQPHRPGEPMPRGETAAGDEQTVPLAPVAAPSAEGDPTILGFPPEPPEDDGTVRLPEGSVPEVPRDGALPEVPRDGALPEVPRDTGAAGAGAEPQSVALAERPAGPLDLPVRLVVLRRPERIGAVALLLAALAANVSLWVPWGEGLDTTGLALAWRGADALASGSGELGPVEQWAPLAVVLSGVVLFFLGLLLFRRARTHRLVGVLALLVSLGALTAVLALLADAGWDPDRLALGTWFAAAVPVLGLLGALKAMLTTPRVTIRPR